MADWIEQPLLFDCDGADLVGVVAIPAVAARVGVLIVVGGPQYRAGSHRQFVLLARSLANAGIASLRFDWRGMGDGEGPRTDFRAANADLRAAIDILCDAVPALECVVLWGLCDGAAACALYDASDRRVAGLVLVNPWVHTETSAAQARLTHYYRGRIGSSGFWRKLLRGDVDVTGATRGLWRTWRRAKGAAGDVPPSASSPEPRLPCRVAAGMLDHAGRRLVLLSGRDTVAAEFNLLATTEPLLAAAMTSDQTDRIEFADTNHTFSRASWRDMLANATLEWLRAHFAADLSLQRAVLASTEEE